MVFLFILLFLLIIILTLKIKIEVHNVNLTLHEPKKNNISTSKHNYNTKIYNIKNNYSIKISFIIINFLPILRFNITSQKSGKLIKRLKNLNSKSYFKSFRKDTSIIDVRKIIQNLNFKIKEFNLKANIGLDSIMLLVFIVPVISTLIAILLTSKKVKLKNQFYQIKPIYNMGNLLNIEFNGIFEQKLIHIIKVIYIINKKRRVEKYDRTSNRRSYGYSYE